jgi:flagellar biosynthesis anti-sigma factor FlgM
MRIDFSQGPQPLSESGAISPQNAAVARSSTLNVGEDEAQLSGAHVQVEALTAQTSQLPELRQERVSALRQAVASGQYQASSKSVAGAMMNQMMFNHMLGFSPA